MIAAPEPAWPSNRPKYTIASGSFTWQGRENIHDSQTDQSTSSPVARLPGKEERTYMTIKQTKVHHHQWLVYLAREREHTWPSNRTNYTIASGSFTWQGRENIHGHQTEQITPSPVARLPGKEERTYMAIKQNKLHHRQWLVYLAREREHTWPSNRPKYIITSGSFTWQGRENIHDHQTDQSTPSPVARLPGKEERTYMTIK